MDSPPQSAHGEAPPSKGPAQVEPPAADDRFGSANWALFAAALGLMAVGYAFLAMAGRDAAGALGRLAPFLIVGGMIVFALGFVPRKRRKP